MDCANRAAVAGLYDELMVEILSRVPVKDLRRCTCVCKSWRDLITDPLNRKKLPQTLEGFFYGVDGGPRSYGHFTSLSGSGVPPVDPSFSFITATLPGVERMVLLDSCNGLLLFGCNREGKFGYIVSNPATEKLVTVPASSEKFEGDVVDVDSPKIYADTFLMFNPAVSSHFHLFQIRQKNASMDVETVHSYSSETMAWSDRSSKWGRGEEDGEWGLWGESTILFSYGYGRALVNGLLHFPAIDYEKKENVIVAVDGEGKICRIIGWDVEDVTTIVFIGQSQDHLHCIGVDLQLEPEDSPVRFTRMSIWVLVDYDTQAWILKHNVSPLHFFGLLGRPLNDFIIAAIHPDHNSIILVQDWNQQLVSYNMDSQELCGLRTLGKDYALITPYVPCFMESSVLATKH